MMHLRMSGVKRSVPVTMQRYRHPMHSVECLIMEMNEKT